MSTVDLSSIVSLTQQLNTVQQLAQSATDPTVKAMLNAQIAQLSAQLAATASHAQAQADASSNIMNSLGLFATLSQTVGTMAPSIISLFKP